MEDFKHLILQHFLFHWLSSLIKVIHPLDLKDKQLYKTCYGKQQCLHVPPPTNLPSPEAKIFFRISYPYKPTLVFPVL